MAAVVAANLTAPLADAKANVVVFAPTNDAFAALISKLGTTPSKLLSDKALLTRVLLYHVAPGGRKLAGATSSITTLGASHAAQTRRRR